jgi:hypothetical protein
VGGPARQRLAAGGRVDNHGPGLGWGRSSSTAVAGCRASSPAAAAARDKEG